MQYTLDTDFSSLQGAEAINWLLDFSDMAEKAFAHTNNHAKLLGNLLVLEMYVQTFRQGLAGIGRMVPVILQNALDLLWDYLTGRKAPSDFQDFANNFYAATLNYNVGEEITDAQAEFFQTHFDDVEQTFYEWQILTWLSVLLMEILAFTGGRVDFEEYQIYEPSIDFAAMQDMLELLGDFYMALMNVPLSSAGTKDVINTQEEIYQTPLFRQLIARIQSTLQTARLAAPAQYPALREKYRQYALLPDDYAINLFKL